MKCHRFCNIKNCFDSFQILDDVSVDGIVDFIKKKNCKNIITMAGAGISTCK